MQSTTPGSPEGGVEPDMDTHAPHPKARLARWLTIALVGAGTVGCAHTTGSETKKADKKLAKLKSRVQQLEKTNGRLSVRLDEMEDEIFLLQDRVEAHRLALKRRGFMNSRTGGKARAKAPQPTPKTNYGRRGAERGRYPVRGRSGHSPRNKSRSWANHPVTRIPLNRGQSQKRGRRRRPERTKRGNEKRRGADSGNEPARPDRADEADGERPEKVVITEKDFQKFANRVEGGGSDETTDDSASTESDSKSGAASGSAKKPVTDEKLPEKEESSKAASASARPSGSSNDSKSAEYAGKSGLDLYKTALAKYRSGNYATALRGFKRFMASGPRKDYRDNGLYWIGECKFGLGNFKAAIDQFQRVLDEEPSGNKVPDAMLKMALAYRELDMKQKARKLLEKLTRRYPATNAGRLGKKKLSQWNS